MGSNIEPFIKDGSLTYIDIFNSFNDWIPEELPYTEETTSLWTALPPKVIKIGPKSNVNDLLSTLFEKIVGSLAGKKGIMIAHDLLTKNERQSMYRI